VLNVKTESGEVALEPLLDLLENSLTGMVWGRHSEDRCVFTALIAANFGSGE
jgi:hypothetical protein